MPPPRRAMSEQDVLTRLDRIERTLSGDERKLDDSGLVGEVRSIKQTLHGPPGQPNGLVGQVDSLRKSLRNLGFSILASGFAVVLTLVLTR
jgi:hypothetical protein